MKKGVNPILHFITLSKYKSWFSIKKLLKMEFRQLGEECSSLHSIDQSKT